jgi:hypothetical protein
VNARASVATCGSEAMCVNGGDVLITVTYAWPGGDPSTGLSDGAQTCIRWFAEPATLLQRPAGYAFGGDCSTNTSGTDAEFAFIAPGAVTFCAQVDAFRGSTNLGSSNLACLDLEPPPDKEFEDFTPVDMPAIEGHALRLVYVDPVPPATIAPGVFVTAVIEFETSAPDGVRIWAMSSPEMPYLGSDVIAGPSGTVVRWVIIDAGACITDLSITMADAETGELLAGGSIEADVCAVTDA